MSQQTTLGLEPLPLPPFDFANFKTILRQAADDFGLDELADIESKGSDFKPFSNEKVKFDSLTVMDLVLEMEEIIGKDSRFDEAWDPINQKEYDLNITLGALYELVCKAGKKTPIY